MCECVSERVKVGQLGDKVSLEAELSPSIHHTLYDGHLTGVDQRLLAGIWVLL